jgi:glycosyltransferase involved in cell wall biosynthesis
VVKRISASPLFDRQFYVDSYADVAGSGIEPALHYLLFGAAEGRDPHPLFSTRYYLQQYPDVQVSGMNPLEHYLCSGGRECRSPHPLFDPSFYREHNPDVAGADVDPLLHFLVDGEPEGRNPHPLFDVSFYLEQNPELKHSDVDPLLHFLEIGAIEGSDPHPLFDTSYYIMSNPEVRTSGVNPLVHFVVTGGARRLNPCPLFDTDYYLSQHPDADPGNPLVSFLHHGLSRCQRPHLLFDTAFYLENNPEASALRENPLVHFITVGGQTGCQPHPLFDSSYYLRCNPEVKAAGDNPLAHYLVEGARRFLNPHPLVDSRYIADQASELEESGQTPLGYYILRWSAEDLDPHPLFDTAYYLEQNPDVRDSKVQPLLQYVCSGAAEGRNPCPLFDRQAYEQSCPTAIEGDPLSHFIEIGADQGLDPSYEFDTSFYLQEHPDVDDTGMNPLAHYVLFGRKEGRPIAPSTPVGVSKGIAVFTEDGNLGGASQIALAIVRMIVTHHPDLRVVAVLSRGGPLEKKFKRYAQVINLDRLTVEKGSPEEALAHTIRVLMARQIYSAILNTVLTGEHARQLKSHGFEIIGLIHELISSVEVYGWGDRGKGHVSHDDCIIFPAQAVRRAFLERFQFPESRTYIQSQGLLHPNPYLEDRERARSWVRRSIDATEEALIVLGCGYADLRKGIDIFREVAQIVCTTSPALDVHFVWMGGGDDFTCGWIRHDLAQVGLEKRVHLIGHVDDPYRYYAGADLFLLTSREDPFPTVNLEAMEASLPVIAYRGSGGAEEILAEDCGVLVSYGAVDRMASETIRLLRSEDERQRIGERASSKVRATQSLTAYVSFLRALFSNLPDDSGYIPEHRRQQLDQSPLNVLIVIGDLDVGGGQMAAIRLANALSESCNVFCTDARPHLAKPEATTLLGPKVRLIDCCGEPQQLRRRIAEHRIDVVNSHIWWADKLSFLAIRESRIPWFITMHGCYEHLLDHESTDREFPKLVSSMLSRADGVIYPADKNLRVFKAFDLRHRGKAEKVYYGIDASDYSTTEPVSLELDDSSFVVGIVSRAIPQKGWEQAIEAVLQINAGQPDEGRTVHLMLIGESDYSRQLASKYSDQPVIHFVGYCRDPAAWIATFDVGLLPTYFESESLPNTVIEYLACGKPTIATEIGEIPHMLVDSGTAAGTLIRLDGSGRPDLQELIRAISRYMEDDELLQRHAQNTEVLMRRFSISTCADRYLQSFTRVIGQASVKPSRQSSGISVVVPLYNHEQFIQAAVESVLAQTVAPDEIIIIDDGSSDGSAGVARHLAKKYDQIRFWSRENRGAHATINEGIEAARGELIAILNSDDLYHPQRFAECIAEMRVGKSPDMVVSRIDFIDDRGRPKELQWYDDLRHNLQWYDEAVETYLATDDLPLSLLRCNFFMTTSNIFVKRSVFERVGGFANLRYTHDLDFFIRLLLDGVSFSFINNALVSYRLHDMNTIEEDPIGLQVELAAVSAFYALSIWRELPPGLAIHQLRYHIHRFVELGFYRHAATAFMEFLTLAQATKNLRNAAQLLEDRDFVRNIHQSLESNKQDLDRLLETAESSGIGVNRLVASAAGLTDMFEPGTATAQPAPTKVHERLQPSLVQSSGDTEISPQEADAIHKMPIILSSPDWSISGVNVVLEALVRRLDGLGFNAQLLITSKPNADDLAHFPDIKHTFLDCGNNSYLERWQALIELFERIKPCIWINGFDFEMSALSPSMPSEIGIIGMTQSDDDMHYEHVNRLGRYWNAIVTVSDYLSHQVAAINPSFEPRIHLVHNGVDLPDAPEIVLPSEDQPLRIITTGRLENQQKRVMDLPLIAQAMDRRGLDYRLTVVGDGEEREALEQALAPQIKAGRVSLPGRVASQKIGQMLSEHTVFLLCSAFEGMPLSMLEGMARGLVPVVSAIKSGIPEAVHDWQNGFIVPIGDAEAFADRFVELQRDPQLCRQMSKAARATVAEGGFDAATMADGYARVILKVGAEILSGEYCRPKPFLEHAEFARILLPPWLQVHRDSRYVNGIGYSFMDQLESATIVTSNNDFVRSTIFSVGGEMRPVLFEHPESDAAFHNLKIRNGSRLEFGIGISDEAVDLGADGVHFKIVVTDSQSEEHMVYSRYIDPTNRVEDRRWIDETVPLQQFDGEVVSITFRTSPGPSSSRMYEWAGWSAPRLRH